jgi:hypothetical protein
MVKRSLIMLTDSVERNSKPPAPSPTTVESAVALPQNKTEINKNESILNI